MYPNVFFLLYVSHLTLCYVFMFQTWCEVPIVCALKQATNFLLRAKRFIVDHILDITALIALLGSSGASAASLIQQVHTNLCKFLDPKCFLSIDHSG